MAPVTQTTVMIVDDHEIMRDGLREVLERSGDFEVVGEAGDGVAAVRTAQQLKPDVVIMDVMIPLKNGIEACREVTEPIPDTRVLILTAATEEDATIEAVAAGANPGIMRVLNDAGIDFGIPNADGLTPMHFAADRGYHPAIKLLASWGADANARTRTGFTSLDMVSNSVNAIRALARAGADLNTRDRRGCTPLHRAAAEGRATDARCLISLGADVDLVWGEGASLLFTQRSATAIQGPLWRSSKGAPTST